MLMKTVSAMTLPLIEAGIVLFCSCSTILSEQGPPTKPKDWQTSLTSFIQHVDSVHNSRTDSGNSFVKCDRDFGLIHFSDMTEGGCAGNNADDVFGSLVQFEGKFIRVSKLQQDTPAHTDCAYQPILSYESTYPGAILSVCLAEADLASWQRLSPGAQVRFQAELSCLTAWETNDGTAAAYFLSLRDARVLPIRLQTSLPSSRLSTISISSSNP